MPPRAVSILILLQMLVIIGGVLAVGTLLHLRDVSFPGRPSPFLVEEVRQGGSFLVLLPLAWALSATLSVRQLDGSPEIHQRWLVAGYALLGLLAVVLIVAAALAADLLIRPVGPMQGG